MVEREYNGQKFVLKVFFPDEVDLFGKYVIQLVLDGKGELIIYQGDVNEMDHNAKLRFQRKISKELYDELKAEKCFVVLLRKIRPFKAQIYYEGKAYHVGLYETYEEKLEGVEKFRIDRNMPKKRRTTEGRIEKKKNPDAKYYSWLEGWYYCYTPRTKDNPAKRIAKFRTEAEAKEYADKNIKPYIKFNI